VASDVGAAGVDLVRPAPGRPMQTVVDGAVVFMNEVE
jgi:hypothetical protein